MKSRVFVTGSLWSLLIYLVYSDLKDIKRTHYFFVDTGIHSSVRKNIKCYVFNTVKWDKYHWRIYQIYSIFSPLLYRLRWPYLFFSDIYGIDQGRSCQAIIGRSKYTLIEDGALDYTISREKKYRRFDLIKKILWGPIVDHDFGNNNLCKKILLTQPPTNDFLKEKAFVVDLLEYWNKSSKEKQNFILSVFNINKEDLLKISGRKVLLLTQPLSEDKIYTEEEKVKIYKDLIDKYGEENIIIKIHPREKTDYTKYFPKATVFDKIVPLQIFSLLGVRFNTVVTICSTAALSLMNENTILDFKGTTSFTLVEKKYGKIELTDFLIN